MNQVSTNFTKPIPPTRSWWTDPNRAQWLSTAQAELPRMRVVPDYRIQAKTIALAGVMGKSW